MFLQLNASTTLMSNKKEAAHESIVDTGIGLIVNLPITYGTIAFGFWLDLSVSSFAIFQTIVFTLISLIRKYYIRLHFADKFNSK